MKLRSYHNPQRVDESKVPEGWRFRYADEMLTPTPFARFTSIRCFDRNLAPSKFMRSNEGGMNPKLTYIVPVNA